MDDFSIPSLDSILDLIDTELFRTGKARYNGPCIYCGGTDRLIVWVNSGETGRYWCNQCNRSGDGIGLLREQHSELSYNEARVAFGLLQDPRYSPARASVDHEFKPVAKNPPLVKPYVQVQPPTAEWQTRMSNYLRVCQNQLWHQDNSDKINYLRSRGFTSETISQAQLGYRYPAEGRLEGITIPTKIGSVLWNINVRQLGPGPGWEISENEPKYKLIKGGKHALWGYNRINYAMPVVMFESVLDALTLWQECKDICTPVATGSTSTCRKPLWIAKLMEAPVVLLAFDNDENGAGEKAAQRWMKRLPHSRRLLPIGEKDANQMLQEGEDLKAWIESGLVQSKAA